jgi:hypothetical protein
MHRIEEVVYLKIRDLSVVTIDHIVGFDIPLYTAPKRTMPSIRVNKVITWGSKTVTELD